MVQLLMTATMQNLPAEITDDNIEFAEQFELAQDAQDLLFRRARTANTFTDEPVTAADLNATLQVAYFIIAVRAAGLAAGPMTGYDADALNAEFFADGQHKVLAVVNIGKAGPGAWMDRLPRLDFDEVVTQV